MLEFKLNFILQKLHWNFEFEAEQNQKLLSLVPKYVIGACACEVTGQNESERIKYHMY